MNIHANRLWSWADWFMVGLRVFGFIMVVITYVVNNEIREGSLGITLSFAILALAIPQLFYLPGHIRPGWFIISETVLAVGFTFYLFSMIPDSNAKSYLYFPVFVLSYMYSQKSYFWIAPSCIVMLALGLYFYVDTPVDIAINFGLNLSLFSVFGFGFGMFLKQKSQLSNLLKTMEQKNLALEHSIKQVERLTLLEERNRMSRELHDTVGHSLTASIVAMEAVQMLIDRDVEASKKRLKQLIEYSRSHLDDFRRTVHDMAMSELKLPLVELLGRAADEFSNQTGTRVIMETDGKSVELTSEAVKLTMLRCLQESMTNSKKHGNASEIRIFIKQGEGVLSMRVCDNGIGSDHVAEGFGIEGMRARVEALRGTLQVDSKEGEGTTVSCTIPIGV